MDIKDGQDPATDYPSIWSMYRSYSRAFGLYIGLWGGGGVAFQSDVLTVPLQLDCRQI